MNNTVIDADLKYITGYDLPWESFGGKTVLISGAAGFLPAYMAETLLYLNKTRRLDIRVIGLVRNLDKARARFARYAGDRQLRLVAQDVCEDFSLKDKIDFIVHAASNATPKFFGSDPVGTILPNVAGTARLLNLAREKQAEGFLFFSSSGVYGFVDPSSYPLKEDCYGALDPTDPASCYLESKRMGEAMCVAWRQQYGVPAKIVRPAITYGPGVKLDDGRSFADFVACILQRRDLELYSDGRALRNYCYLADAVAGFWTVWLKGEEGKAYNVASEQEITVGGLAELLVREIFPERGLKVVRKADASKNFLRMNFPRTAVDVSRLKALGWRQEFSLADGFRRTVKSFEERSA